MEKEKNYGESDDKLLSIISHLGFLSGIGAVFVPLIIYLLKKEQSPFLAHHAKQALVYQGAMLVLGIVLGFGSQLFVMVTLGFGALLLIPMALLLTVLFMIPPVMASVGAYKGEQYTYPVVGGLADNF